MRKEVVLAVITGIILGGVILYGLNLANNSVQTQKPDETGIAKPSTAPTQITTTSNLSFVSPQNHAVITDTAITLKGTAKPNTEIAIVSENDDILTTSDGQGNFSANITLINGENIITIASVDSNLSTASASISVIHTTSLPE